MKQKIISIIIVILILSGCAQNQSNISVFTKMKDFELNLENNNEINENISNNNFEETIKNSKSKKNIKISTQKNPPVFSNKIKILKFNSSTNNSIVLDNEKIALNVENIPIPDFIKLVFGQILKLNYSIPEDIEKYNKTITLKMQQKVSKAKFFVIVKNLLNNNGIIFEEKDGIYYFKKGKLKPIQKLSNIVIYLSLIHI
jgi:uncharacterized protein YneF (UPF0154 family)